MKQELWNRSVTIDRDGLISLLAHKTVERLCAGEGQPAAASGGAALTGALAASGLCPVIFPDGEREATTLTGGQFTTACMTALANTAQGMGPLRLTEASAEAVMTDMVALYTKVIEALFETDHDEEVADHE